jgi:hypothetical protein
MREELVKTNDSQGTTMKENVGGFSRRNVLWWW